MRANCERVSHAAPDVREAERIVRDFSTKLAAADALLRRAPKAPGHACDV